MSDKDYPLTNLEMLAAIIAEPGLEAESNVRGRYKIVDGRLLWDGEDIDWPKLSLRYRLLRPEPLVPVTLDTALIQSLDESFEWSEDTNRKWQHRFALAIAQAVRMSREAA